LPWVKVVDGAVGFASLADHCSLRDRDQICKLRRNYVKAYLGFTSVKHPKPLKNVINNINLVIKPANG